VSLVAERHGGRSLQTASKTDNCRERPPWHSADAIKRGVPQMASNSDTTGRRYGLMRRAVSWYDGIVNGAGCRHEAGQACSYQPAHT
jgi:hypothetical protein